VIETSCSTSDCDAGYAASKIAAESDKDCIKCSYGYYSLGGSQQSCLNLNCPAGKMGSLMGATSDSDGCIICNAGT